MDTTNACAAMILLAVLLQQNVDASSLSNTADPCSPNPCHYHGICGVVKGNVTCQCYAPSYGPRCETVSGFIKSDWVLSLAFSIPIALLIIVSVIIYYLINHSRQRQKREQNELQIDFDPPTVMTNPHASPLDTPRSSAYVDDPPVKSEEDLTTSL